MEYAGHRCEPAEMGTDSSEKSWRHQLKTSKPGYLATLHRSVVIGTISGVYEMPNVTGMI